MYMHMLRVDIPGVYIHRMEISAWCMIVYLALFLPPPEQKPGRATYIVDPAALVSKSAIGSLTGTTYIGFKKFLHRESRKKTKNINFL